MPGGLGQLDHIGIAVISLEPVRAGICALLGGEVTYTGHDAKLQADATWIESDGNPIMELLAPTGPGPIADYLERHGPSLHHLAFRTSSLDASREHVERCGFGIIGEDHNHGGYEEFFVDPAATGSALFRVFRSLSA